jgi:hypothetical protein
VTIVHVRKVQPGKETRRRDEYLGEYYHFKNDLAILKRLNTQLPEAVKNIVTTERKVLQKKAEGFGDKDIRELDRLRRHFDQALKGRPTKPVRLNRKVGRMFFGLLSGMMFENRGVMLIRDMSLVYLVAAYEGFLQAILSVLFAHRPEILMSTRKVLTTEELIECDDISAVRERVSEKEIELVIRQDIEERKAYFRDRLGIDLQGFVDWKGFSERFYRRNIIVHNSAITNEVYRRKTGYRGRDRRMTVSQTYLSQSIQLFQTMAEKTSKSFRSKFR